MMITKRYSYEKISRKQVEGKRLYTTPSGEAVPSVTTILDKTKSKEKIQALANWKKRVGEQKAQEIVTEASGRGTRMHKYLEDYILNSELSQAGSNPFSQQSRKMAQEIIDNGLCDVDEYWGVEVPLYFPKIYAGTTDCVGTYKGKPAIIDFKQTNKPKKTEWIQDYFLQLAAYSEAHNEVHGSEIKTGVILMCSAEFKFQMWVLEGEEFENSVKTWWNRVEQYYLKHH
jgi:hypothetical protein